MYDLHENVLVFLRKRFSLTTVRTQFATPFDPEKF